LQAVNPGGDTDTTAAVTGGLAGLFYGLDNISEQWLKQLARYDDINDLAERLVARTTYLFSVNFFPLHAFGNHRIFM
jgi:ADP-ribosylglycohydrolase